MGSVGALEAKMREHGKLGPWLAIGQLIEEGGRL